MPQLKERRIRLKGNTSEVTREEISQLSAQYLIRRNRAIDLKNKENELTLAEKRGELIERRLVVKQASYLLTNIRQKLLNLSSHAHKFIGLTDLNQSKAILREIGLHVLEEVKDLPNVVNPSWLETLEKDEGK